MTLSQIFFVIINFMLMHNIMNQKLKWINEIYSLNELIKNWMTWTIHNSWKEWNTYFKYHYNQHVDFHHQFVPTAIITIV
jgi:hypothetical protein